MDKLRAQQESRGKHGVFHDELERASEPFEIVAKHFGYGLFNRIVIFDENDIKTTTTPERRLAVEKSGGELFKRTVGVVPAANSSRPVTTVNTNFGSGAEAKMRVTENKSRVIPAPMSEARMRLQEQQQRSTNAYSSSLEANIDWSVARNRPGQGAVQKVNQPVKQMPPTSYPKSINPFGEPTNPFGEDDDDGGAVEEKPKQPATRPEYKKELDPFADDVDEDVSNNNSGVGEDKYDKSLNPFED